MQNRQACLINGLLFLLLLVFSIPSTIALRYLLMAMLLVIMLASDDGRACFKWVLRENRPLQVLLVLTVWLLLQLLWAKLPLEVLGELKGQWFTALLCFGIGAGFALTKQSLVSKLRLLHYVFFAGLLAMFFDYVFQFFSWGLPVSWSGIPVFSNGIEIKSHVMASKVQVAFFCTLSFVFYFAELVSRLLCHKRLLPVALPVLVLTLLLAVLLNIFSGARNGFVGLSMTFLSGCFLIFIFEKKITVVKKTLIMLCIVLLSLGGALLSYKLDPRWNRFLESAVSGMQFESSQAWVDPHKWPYPLLADGNLVDVSAYERVAFLSAGVSYSLQSPLGTGFSRSAFMHEVESRYASKARHAHSGMVEFLISMGYPGLFLWLLVLFGVAGLGVYRLRQGIDMIGVWSVLLTLGFAGRMVVENISRDHMLMMFMLFCGFLSTILQHEKNNAV